MRKKLLGLVIIMSILLLGGCGKKKQETQHSTTTSTHIQQSSKKESNQTHSSSSSVSSNSISSTSDLHSSSNVAAAETTSSTSNITSATSYPDVYYDDKGNITGDANQEILPPDEAVDGYDSTVESSSEETPAIERLTPEQSSELQELMDNGAPSGRIQSWWMEQDRLMQQNN